jgi:CubicO group peptidase (beta-lactamase class C family)
MTEDAVGETGPQPAVFETFLDNRVPEQLDEHEIAGATVAVVADGETKVAKGYGYADVDSEQPVEADETPFDIASVSKAITGTAVIRAVEAGLVDLDTDINEYLEAFSIPGTYSEPITLEHLGTHTAGFTPQHIGEYTFDEDDIPPLGEAVAEDPPTRVRPPGEIASYSNYGFALAGHIIAGEADTTYADFIQKQVFDPLGMDGSTARLPRPDGYADTMSKAYGFEGGEFRRRDVRQSWRRPAGGIAATATDMAAFMRMHLNRGRFDGRQYLPPQTVSGMHAQRFENHSAIDSVGYGFIEETRGKTRFVGMTGDGQSFHSAMALFPDQGIGLFVAYNTQGAGEARNELVDAFAEEYAPPGKPVPLVPDGHPARASELEGSYRHTRVAEESVAKLIGAAATLQVRIDDDGTLVTQPEIPGPTDRWVEIEPLVFRKIGDHDRLAFREVDGEITYAFMSAQSGLERLQPHQRTVVHLVVTAAFLVAFIGALFGWTGGWLWRRYKDRPTLTGGPFRARLLAAASGSLLLSVIVAGVIAVAVSGSDLLTGLPIWFRGAQALATTGVVGAIAILGWSLVAWRDDYWGPMGRVHYTVLATTSIGFALVLAYWNLIWSPF